MKTRLPLAYQILAFQVAIILLSALMGVGAAVWQASQGLDMQYEQRSLAIAQSVASNSAVQEALLNGDPAGLIQKTAEQIRNSTGATYVVVTDRDGIRYSHPNPAMIGKPVDENPATVLAGNTWVGVQQGTLGISARGKAPIFHEGNVIGLVSVGFLETAVFNQLMAELPGFAATLLLALGLGVAGSMLLASRLKRQTFGLEPYEIAGSSRSARRACRESTKGRSPQIVTAPSPSPTTRPAGSSACRQTASAARSHRCSPRAGS